MSTGISFEALDVNTLSRKKIFSEKTKFQGKKSNVRYSNTKENFDPGQVSGPPAKGCHRRSGSHHRQQSIYFPPEVTTESVINSLKPGDKPDDKPGDKPPKHRNLSDADSVILLGPAEKEATQRMQIHRSSSTTST